MNVLLLLMGLALIVGGAHFLTEGAADIAKKLRVSEFVIGLTIVGFGTSAPELVVSVMSAINGQSDMAIGNVVGSNLCNVFVILAITAIIRPVKLSPGNLKIDLPLGLLAAAVLFVMASDVLLGLGEVNVITRGEGITLLCLFIIFMVYSFMSAGKGVEEEAAEEFTGKKQPPVWVMILMVAGGLAALIFGGNMFLDSATGIARALGVSESVIAITLVAGGTSLPELATSVAAIIKRKGDLALGNILGSNIFNIFLILGVSSTIAPLTLGGIVWGDLAALMAINVLLIISYFTFRKGWFDRAEGIIFLLLYGGYIWWLLVR